ncbi:hypothetical protein [Nocardioides nitrophenolicus]|uniref:hypothetical protein n=1 Tax=Nocardioides nitrophenolicus TaxID=60489 RepID=UPI000AD8893A|nr:hypothetical protein [Nocardioides nitrophenolicus]MBM7519209.1 hypothetical protein [Nocardioides nitrophenolicus]
MAETYAEDLNLDPGQFPELNRRFFAADRGPHLFIRHRMRGLILAASSDEEIRAKVESGLTLGELRLTAPDHNGPLGEDGVAEVAALDAIVLFHHAAETLLQLFFVLEAAPACPWLEIAKIKREHRLMTKRLRNLRSQYKSQKTKEALVRVFCAQELSGPENIEKEQWADIVLGLRLVVAEAAKRFQEETNLYNSAKHGLSAVTGRATLRLGEESNPLIDMRGPSLTILEPRPTGAGTGHKWHETTRWVETEKTVAMTGLMAHLIENAWHIARATYADGPRDTRLRYLSGAQVDQMLHGDYPETGYKMTVTEFPMPLLYRSAPAALGGPEDDSSHTGALDPRMASFQVGHRRPRES